MENSLILGEPIQVGDKVVVTLPNGNEINYTIKKIS